MTVLPSSSSSAGFHVCGNMVSFATDILVDMLAPVELPDQPEEILGLLPVLRWLSRTSDAGTIVELGVATGVTYLEFCAGAPNGARCHGVDQWAGNDRLYRQLLRRHDLQFGAFSTLHRMTPAAAAAQIPDGSVDVLHIAASVVIDAVPDFFDIWRPKLRPNGVVAVSGTADRDNDRGTWRLLSYLEITNPSFVFRHYGGLALICAGQQPPPSLAALITLDGTQQDSVRRAFLRLGETVIRLAAAETSERQRETERSDHQREYRASQDAIAHLNSLLEAGRQREEGTKRQSDQLQLQLNDVYRSTSWRITGPLRRASRLFSKLKQRIHRTYPQGATTFQTIPAAAPAADPKQAFKNRMAAELTAFLKGSARLTLPRAEDPQISILLILYNQAPLTFGCLKALIDNTDVPAEVIIVDNASSDDTAALLDRIDGAIIIRNTENLHFLRAVNQGAGEAKGRHLLLLNNDACLKPGALTAAVETLQSADDIGAVGGKIVLLDGTLQEAGSIIWRDGTCLGYGRGKTPTDPEFQFRRDVDYCSGAFLLVKRDIFERLGRLDMAFAPAYYEETDFCMRLRNAGYRIVYDPRVEILHYEFGSSSSSEQALALQRRNHKIFIEKHQNVLAERHHLPDVSPLIARMVPPQRGRILIIEDRVPFPSLGAGYPRASHIVKILHDLGCFVTFYPLLYPEAEMTAIREEFPAEIEFMTGYGLNRLDEFLTDRAGYYDAILISRPHNMRTFRTHYRHNAQLYRNVKIIYDAEAVFAPREAKRLALAGTPLPPAEERAMLREELDLATPAQDIITVNDLEASLFLNAGYSNVHVLGHMLEPRPISTPFFERQDFLFVGALDDDPSPNTDSLIWFAENVMPLIDPHLGTDWRLIVAGRCGAARVRALASSRIKILGQIDTLDDVFKSARVFIAPTRYAAGMPHKVHEAVSRGLPTIATSLLAAQLGWTNDVELLAADMPQDFAAACTCLYRDSELWSRLQTTALRRLTDDCSPKNFESVLAQIVT